MAIAASPASTPYSDSGSSIADPREQVARAPLRLEVGREREGEAAGERAPRGAARAPSARAL